MQHNTLTADGAIQIYQTKKMRVEIGEFSVVKIFKIKPGSNKRYKCEKEALQRFKGTNGLPELLNYSDQQTRLVMKRLPGKNVEKYSDEHLLRIRELINEALRLGVARHSLPDRDILVNGNDVGIVDFERISLRSFAWLPIWKMAKYVTQFHVSRLISRHNPNLLSATEQRVLKVGLLIYKPFKNLRLAIKPYRARWRNRKNK